MPKSRSPAKAGWSWAREKPCCCAPAGAAWATVASVAAAATAAGSNERRRAGTGLFGCMAGEPAAGSATARASVTRGPREGPRGLLDGGALDAHPVREVLRRVERPQRDRERE